MGIPEAAKLNRICCRECRQAAIRAVLSPYQLLIYDTIVAGDGKLTLTEITKAVAYNEPSVSVIVGRMRRANLVKAAKNNEDYRRTYYSAVLKKVEL